MNPQLDHIAVLTRSVEKTADSLPESLKRHPVESFPAEGTKEQYVELMPHGGPCLLLLEAIADGPYRRSLQKRGPGLHHLGCLTDDLEAGVRYFSRAGLLLHPFSLETVKNKVIWMCRPGIPFLIELSGRPCPASAIVPEMELELPCLTARISWVPGLSIVASGDESIRLSNAEGRMTIDV